MSTEPKKTDSWMPLWIGDYLADTMTLNAAQHGAYLLLLFAYWRNKGPLEDDDEDLATIAKATPAEWKKLRVKLLRFFDVDGGLWTHPRADKELKKAGIFAEKAHARAVKAANARWGAKAPAQAMQQACSEHASSIAQGVLNSCPSPSPSPIGIGNQTDVAEEERGRAREISPEVSGLPRPAVLCCMAMREAGVASVNASHPDLDALIGQGATPDLFRQAANKAVADGKGSFAYVVGMVKGQMADAARTRSTPMAMPTQAHPTETAHARKMRETVEGLAPSVARRSNAPAAPTPLTIDIEAVYAPAIARH
jgi:uncharacterized protein YdaU (DUF1376 family)